MKPNRIAMISYHTCPLASLEGKETGGMNVYVLELSKKLGELGIVVDIFTRSQSDKHNHVVQISPNVRLFHIPAGPEKALPKKLLLDHIEIFYKNVKKIINEEELQYDLVHAHYYMSGIVGLKFQKDYEVPLVTTFHTLALMKNLVARGPIEWQERERIDSEIILAKKSEKIIALSESDKNYISYLYNGDKKKIEVVSPGVDTALFRPIKKTPARNFIHATPEDKIILFVGRIEPLKGVDSLLYAFKILMSKNKKINHKICLWIVGGDTSQKMHLWSKELQKLENLRRVLGIKTAVKFVGQRPQSELPYYYSAADVVVMPSHYETFGIVALEAMACGTAVISTHVTGLTSTLENQRGLHVVPANSPIHLARQIETIITNGKKHSDMAIRLVNQVRDFTWQRVAEKTLLIYRQLH